MSHISLIPVKIPSSCSSMLSFLLFIKVVWLFHAMGKEFIHITAFLVVRSRWDHIYLTARASPGPGHDSGFLQEPTCSGAYKECRGTAPPHPTEEEAQGHLQSVSNLCSSRVQLLQHHRKALNWGLEMRGRDKVSGERNCELLEGCWKDFNRAL